MKKRLLALLLAGLILSSCAAPINDGKSMTDVEETIETDITKEDESMKNNIFSAAAGEPVGAAIDENFIEVLADFSGKLYSAVSEENKGNMIFSPLSVMYALSLCANGAAGETLREFEELFGGTSISDMNQYLFTLRNCLDKEGDSKVNIANSVWGNRDSFEISRDFADVAKRYYNADAESVSFSDSNSLDLINKWVSEKTDGMINNAVDDLDPSLAMILLNTILFDGVWAVQYEDNKIGDAPFANYDGSESKVEFMYSTENSYFEVDGGEGFCKDYKGGYKFVAVKPYGDVREFVKNMNVSDILASVKNAGGTVDVSIPKFEYERKVDLVEILRNLGLERAFTDTAELGGLQESGKNNLAISDILQNAKIITNEHGTKAAAVTEIMVRYTSIRMTKTIYLDKPFFYMIVDENNAPLFMGTIENLA